MVIVHGRTEVARWSIGEGVGFQERENFRLALQKSDAEVDKPRTGFVVRLHYIQSLEPHLPVEAGLVGCDESGAAGRIARLVFEFVGLPCLAIIAAFNDYFRPSG